VAYYLTANIMTVKSFIVKGPGILTPTYALLTIITLIWVAYQISNRVFLDWILSFKALLPSE
jgi:hypothetical protein